MKYFLPTFLFLFIAAMSFGQSSFSQRLAFNPPKTDKVTVKVYPNPVITEFGVTTSSAYVAKIKVFNLVGKVVREFSYAKTSRYYIGDLPKGMYMIQFLNSKNKILVTHQVAKK